MNSLRDRILVALCTDHGHAHRTNSLACRSCNRRADSATQVLTSSAPPEGARKALIRAICFGHDEYSHRDGEGCRCCSRRADKLLEVASPRKVPES